MNSVAYSLLLMLQSSFRTRMQIEILALRHQLAMLQRHKKRVRLRAGSALDPRAEPYQNLIDQLFFRMAGLSESEARGLEERLAQML
jgi:hypothetical protein